MNEAYQTAHEYQYLLYEGLENFLRMLELSKANVSQAILTEVLEYEVDPVSYTHLTLPTSDLV